MASERLQPTSVNTRSEAEERCKAQADAMLLQKARTKAAKQLCEFQGILEQELMQSKKLCSQTKTKFYVPRSYVQICGLRDVQTLADLQQQLQQQISECWAQSQESDYRPLRVVSRGGDGTGVMPSRLTCERNCLALRALEQLPRGL